MIDDPASKASANAAAARAARRLEMLRELAEIGVAMARTTRRQLLEADPEDKAELALAFSRIAWNVRQTLALEARLARSAASRASFAERPVRYHRLDGAKIVH